LLQSDQNQDKADQSNDIARRPDAMRSYGYPLPPVVAPGWHGNPIWLASGAVKLH